MDNRRQRVALQFLIPMINTEEEWNMIVQFTFEDGQYTRDRVRLLEKIHSDIVTNLYAQGNIYEATRILQVHQMWLENHPNLKGYVVDMEEYKAKSNNSF